ncbi:uncharacterized protein [Apostichopus japonicus]|uniref:uncharacterized protein isoform X5 n=1 Tax=Stichopus japonicus TaxID=307972 RepID=UPI003AB23AE8
MAGNDVQDQENTALASESLLQDLAGKLVGWKFLGRQLGLTEANLDDIEQDNRESKEKKYQTLLQWKRTSAQRPTIGCLANALKKMVRWRLLKTATRLFKPEHQVERAYSLHAYVE